MDSVAIYESDLNGSVQPQLIKLRVQEYELKKKALDTLIEQKLLEAAAKKKGITTDKLLELDVDAKVASPTDGEVEAYYLGQKDRLNRPLTEVRDQLRVALNQARIQQARRDNIDNLRKAAAISILLAPPKVQVGFDPQRLHGSPKAPVMIVEFSDFQCPYCRGVEATLKDVLGKYEGKVSLAYRDFPLVQIHPQAELAAMASRCAAEQQKFWQYHDQLFANTQLEPAALVQYARAVKLDEVQFSSCLASGKYKLDVQRDAQEATQAGVSGTPAFFVNGVPLSGAQSADAFSRVIEQELVR